MKITLEVVMIIITIIKFIILLLNFIIRILVANLSALYVSMHSSLDLQNAIVILISSGEEIEPLRGYITCLT